MTYTLRPYQQEDGDAVMAAFEQHQRVLGEAATGLGKAVLIQWLVKQFVDQGRRVLVLADMGVLVDQLAATIRNGTGIEPAIERADERADGFLRHKSPVIVSTVQTQFSGPNHAMRCMRFDPHEFGLVVADEAEAFIAPKYRAVLKHYLKTNKRCKLFGCTATPLRSDGQGMGRVFQHVAFRRPIRWGVENGYLVPPRQGSVVVNADWSTLRTSKGDYADSSLSRILSDMGEQKSLEFAKGIIDQAGDKQSIVVLPKVNNAIAVSQFINAHSPNSARFIHGRMADAEVRETLDAHKAHEFQFLCSVNMLTKGYDDPGIHNIFMCRPTRSKRLYTQVLGRGARLADPSIGGLESVEERRSAIYRSEKPYMTMFNMVGQVPTVRDLNVVDVLAGREVEPSARALASKRMQDRPDRDALAEIEAAIAEDAAIREQLAAEERERVRVEAEVVARFTDPFGAVSQPEFKDRIPWQSATKPAPRTVELLRRNRVPQHVIERLSASEAGQLSRRIIQRHHVGLSTYRQCEFLRQHGIDAHNMTKAEASERIDKVIGGGS